MTLPIIIPPTPTSLSVDDTKSNNSNNDLLLPRTPISPLSNNSQQQQQLQASAQAQIKRKPSRRANTAERRATHNAVERQRRETLNGRFLDLAGLLPNLSQIRRPSKSSIVNSSIAHIHASRRHRLLAARELRLLKVEADTLRRELNEWRERSGIQRIEEPVRGDGFGIVLSAELEVIVGQDIEEEDEDDYGPQDVHPRQASWDSADLDDYGMESADGHVAPASAGVMEDSRLIAMLKTQNPFAHNPPAAVSVPMMPRQGATNVPAFEALYEHAPPQLPQQQQQQLQMLQQQQQYLQQQQQQQQAQRQQQQQEQEKMWGLFNPTPRIAQFAGQQQQQQQQQFQQNQPQYQQQHMMIQAQRSLYTPPASSHGLPTPSPTTSAAGSPPSPPSSDHGHGPLVRERSGSIHSIHSVSSHHSSQRGSHSPSYELGLGMGVDYLSPLNVGLGQNEYSVGVPRMMGEMQLASPVSAGGNVGGGGGGLFAMMM
jgi:hypothetical protein